MFFPGTGDVTDVGMGAGLSVFVLPALRILFKLLLPLPPQVAFTD